MIKKIFKISLIVIAVLLVTVYLVTMFAISPIVSGAVEKFAPEITGCEVKVESVSVSFLLDGVTVKGITVGNPEGYKTDNAFQLTKFSVDISLLSLLTDEIVVEEIIIDGAVVTVEQGLTTNNLLTIKSNIDKFVAKSAPKEEPVEEKEEPKEETEPGKKLIIEDFYFTNAKVKFSVVGVGGAALPIPIPTLHLEDIGKSEDGESEGASVGEVLTEVYDAVMDAIFSVTDVAGKGLSKAGDAITDGASAVGDAASEAAKKAGSLIKGIFGGDDD